VSKRFLHVGNNAALTVLELVLVFHLLEITLSAFGVGGLGTRVPYGAPGPVSAARVRLCGGPPMGSRDCALRQGYAYRCKAALACEKGE